MRHERRAIRDFVCLSARMEGPHGGASYVQVIQRNPESHQHPAYPGSPRAPHKRHIPLWAKVAHEARHRVAHAVREVHPAVAERDPGEHGREHHLPAQKHTKKWGAEKNGGRSIFWHSKPKTKNGGAALFVCGGHGVVSTCSPCRASFTNLFV